ncbi:MAG TPA: S8 family serine peptidase [Candidatus Eisenbacteria bacterium]|jgi:subtilisin family serine protease
MTTFRYFSAGKLRLLRVGPLGALIRAAARRAPPRYSLRTFGGLALDLDRVGSALDEPSRWFGALAYALTDADMLVESDGVSGTVTLPTETVVVDGATASEMRWLRDRHGFDVVREGRQGKVLLRAPRGGAAGVADAFEVGEKLIRRGNVAAAHPNFVRALLHIARPDEAASEQWNLQNDGHEGLYGADVHARAAWTITRGSRDVRVAVLDEGVDTRHPSLAPAVVAELDGVEGKRNALPDGNDAHGTACAGIVLSRDSEVSGLAPESSLVAARIARGDGAGHWILDDFDTADAIDWCWEEARADVLSNSWGGGPPTDVITRAFERARSKGRRGRGCVIVAAAGNEQGPVNYPARLPFVLGVGASNPWDEMKTRASKDGESWWGTNRGPGLDLLAPAVRIRTTDIHGPRGYGYSDFIADFNGTSAATPHVAAAAALILAVARELTAQKVRDIIIDTADPLSTASGRRSQRTGSRRLNTYAALRAALRAA